jgi:hypothetical protein
VSTENPWITSRIAEARKQHPLVTNATSTRIEALLNGELSEGQLSKTALNGVAASLIADMTPPKEKQ